MIEVLGGYFTQLSDSVFGKPKTLEGIELHTIVHT